MENTVEAAERKIDQLCGNIEGTKCEIAEEIVKLYYLKKFSYKKQFEDYASRRFHFSEKTVRRYLDTGTLIEIMKKNNCTPVIRVISHSEPFNELKEEMTTKEKKNMITKYDEKAVVTVWNTILRQYKIEGVTIDFLQQTIENYKTNRDKGKSLSSRKKRKQTSRRSSAMRTPLYKIPEPVPDTYPEHEEETEIETEPVEEEDEEEESVSEEVFEDITIPIAIPAKRIAVQIEAEPEQEKEKEKEKEKKIRNPRKKPKIVLKKEDIAKTEGHIHEVLRFMPDNPHKINFLTLLLALIETSELRSKIRNTIQMLISAYKEDIEHEQEQGSVEIDK